MTRKEQEKLGKEIVERLNKGKEISGFNISYFYNIKQFHYIKTEEINESVLKMKEHMEKIENNKNIKLAIFIYCINISVSVNTAYILKNIKYIVIIDAYTKLFNTFPVTKSFIFFTILFFSFESFSNFLSSFLFVYMPFYHFFLDL